MTDIQALADCIVSGQVEAADIVRLRAEHPGLGWILERRSSAMSPALIVQAGRGASISSPDGLRPANPIHFPGDCALTHRLGKEESRRPLKTRGLLSKLIRSIHLPSLLRTPWRT